MQTWLEKRGRMHLRLQAKSGCVCGGVTSFMPGGLYACAWLCLRVATAAGWWVVGAGSQGAVAWAALRTRAVALGGGRALWSSRLHASFPRPLPVWTPTPSPDAPTCPRGTSSLGPGTRPPTCPHRPPSTRTLPHGLDLATPSPRWTSRTLVATRLLCSCAWQRLH